MTEIRVPLPGVTVLADRWSPPGRRARPVVLVRTPYGRRGPGLLYAPALVRRGLTVVVSSVRGTSHPTDALATPFTQEAADGAATLSWLAEQPFCDGRVAAIGLSYLGYAAWALAAAPHPALRALVVQAAPHEMAGPVWPGGAFTLADSLGWAQLVSGPWREAGPMALVGAARRRRALVAAERVPLGAAALAATGRPVPWWAGWVDHPAPDPYWEAYDQGAALERVDVPVLVQGGWYDLFRRPSIAQHTALAARGVPTALTMGPTTHAGMLRAWPSLIGAAADFLAEALQGEVPAACGRVRTAVLGGAPRTWASWPPPGAATTQWEVGADLTGAARRFTHDPAEPAPSVGGPLLGPGAGGRDQAAVEARSDVVCFTGPVLGRPVEVAGPVRARLELRSSGPHQVVVRCCDVDLAGRSVNVCDGVATSPGGDAVVEVDLGPLAARFAAGHRIRLQVAAAAFPRYAVAPGPPVEITVTGGRLEAATLPPDRTIGR